MKKQLSQFESKLKELVMLRTHLDDSLYSASSSVIAYAKKPMGGDAIKKVQSLAASAIREIEHDVDAAMLYARCALKEIGQLEDGEGALHQCYDPDRDNKCDICGKEL